MWHSASLRVLRYAAIGLTMIAAGCGSELDDTRIPAFSVQINLGNPGMWNVYGVQAYGQSVSFIRDERTPASFPFTETTYTGYGGVLLIMGMNPFDAGTMTPLAYDLSCPVECKPYIRVAVDADNFEAVCPVCGSRYDVTMAGGAPTQGPALTGSVKYGLQRYNVWPRNGGYIISR